jgi:hypothetical protein
MNTLDQKEIIIVTDFILRNDLILNNATFNIACANTLPTWRSDDLLAEYGNINISVAYTNYLENFDCNSKA